MKPARLLSLKFAHNLHPEAHLILAATPNQHVRFIFPLSWHHLELDYITLNKLNSCTHI